MQENFFYKRLGRRVCDERKRMKITQEELAFLCRIDRTYMARIEEGKANPTIRVLFNMSRALKLRIHDLIHGL